MVQQTGGGSTKWSEPRLVYSGKAGRRLEGLDRGGGCCEHGWHLEKRVGFGGQVARCCYARLSIRNGARLPPGYRLCRDLLSAVSTLLAARWPRHFRNPFGLINDWLATGRAMTCTPLGGRATAAAPPPRRAGAPRCSAGQDRGAARAAGLSRDAASKRDVCVEEWLPLALRKQHNNTALPWKRAHSSCQLRPGTA